MKASGSANCYTARCPFQLIIYPSPCPVENKPFALLPQDNNKKAIRTVVDVYLQYTPTHSDWSVNKVTIALHHRTYTQQESRPAMWLLQKQCQPDKTNCYNT